MQPDDHDSPSSPNILEGRQRTGIREEPPTLPEQPLPPLPAARIPLWLPAVLTTAVILCGWSLGRTLPKDERTPLGGVAGLVGMAFLLAGCFSDSLSRGLVAWGLLCLPLLGCLPPIVLPMPYVAGGVLLPVRGRWPEGVACWCLLFAFTLVFAREGVPWGWQVIRE